MFGSIYISLPLLTNSEKTNKTMTISEHPLITIDKRDTSFLY